MENTPLVSIITPCYNSASYLSRYMDSILAQTYNRMQLILVNDGSRDNTEEVILSYEKPLREKGCELTYVKQENTGIGGAVNRGLKEIRGEYFAWCDSDNFYTPDYVERKVRFFQENPQYSIVRCDGSIVNENAIDVPLGNMAWYRKDLYKEDLFENCLYIRNFHFGCAMLKTADFDKVNPQREIYPSREGQNWQLLLPMFYHYKSGYIDKAMFCFVVRGDSVSNIAAQKGLDAQIRQNAEYAKILTTTLKGMHLEQEDTYIHNVLVRYAKMNLRLSREAGNKEKAREFFGEVKSLNAMDIWDLINYGVTQYKAVEYLIKVIRLPWRIIVKLRGK